MKIRKKEFSSNRHASFAVTVKLNYESSMKIKPFLYYIGKMQNKSLSLDWCCELQIVQYHNYAVFWSFCSFVCVCNLYAECVSSL